MSEDVKAPVFSAQSYSPKSLAAAEGCSVGLVYKLWRQERGPRFYYAGSRRRVTEQARQDWHREREAVAAETAAKLSARLSAIAVKK